MAGAITAFTSTAVAFVVFPELGTPVHVSVFLSGVVFSLFPDIDIKSTSSKIFYSVFLIYLVLLYLMKRYALGHISAIFGMIPQITRHRGLFHHPITAVILPSYPIFVWINGYMQLNVAIAISLAGIGGYFTHLFLDKA